MIKFCECCKKNYEVVCVDTPNWDILCSDECEQKYLEEMENRKKEEMEGY